MEVDLAIPLAGLKLCLFFYHISVTKNNLKMIIVSLVQAMVVGGSSNAGKDALTLHQAEALASLATFEMVVPLHFLLQPSYHDGVLILPNIIFEEPQP